MCNTGHLLRSGYLTNASENQTPVVIAVAGGNCSAILYITVVIKRISSLTFAQSQRIDMLVNFIWFSVWFLLGNDLKMFTFDDATGKRRLSLWLLLLSEHLWWACNVAMHELFFLLALICEWRTYFWGNIYICFLKSLFTVATKLYQADVLDLTVPWWRHLGRQPLSKEIPRKINVTTMVQSKR